MTNTTHDPATASLGETAAVEAIARLIAHLAAEKLDLHAGLDGADLTPSWGS